MGSADQQGRADFQAAFVSETAQLVSKTCAWSNSMVYSLRFDSVEMDVWAACHAFSLHHKCAKHYSANWFNCLIACPFWAK